MERINGSCSNPWPLVQVFSEVALLERLAGLPAVCTMYDYGLDGVRPPPPPPPPFSLRQHTHLMEQQGLKAAELQSCFY